MPAFAGSSEEEIALVGFPFRPAVPSETHFLGIVGAEFVAKKLAVCCTPRLQFAINDRQMFPAKSAAGRSVLHTDDFSHLLSLTPDQEPRSSRSCNTGNFSKCCVQSDTILNEPSGQPAFQRRDGKKTSLLPPFTALLPQCGMRHTVRRKRHALPPDREHTSKSCNMVQLSKKKATRTGQDGTCPNGLPVTSFPVAFMI